MWLTNRVAQKPSEQICLQRHHLRFSMVFQSGLRFLYSFSSTASSLGRLAANSDKDVITGGVLAGSGSTGSEFSEGFLRTTRRTGVMGLVFVTLGLKVIRMAAAVCSLQA